MQAELFQAGDQPPAKKIKVTKKKKAAEMSGKAAPVINNTSGSYSAKDIEVLEAATRPRNWCPDSQA